MHQPEQGMNRVNYAPLALFVSKVTTGSRRCPLRPAAIVLLCTLNPIGRAAGWTRPALGANWLTEVAWRQG